MQLEVKTPIPCPAPPLPGHSVCRHPEEIALLKRLDDLGVEGILHAARRRDRVWALLGAAVLTAFLGLAAWTYTSDLHAARTEEQLKARVHQLELTAISRSGVNQELARLSGSIESLNLRLVDRLQAIDRRLSQIESRSQNSRQRNR